MKVPHPRHSATAAELNVIAAQEFILPVEFPPWHVHVHSADAIMIVRRHIQELREISIARTANAVGKIAPDHARRICNAIRKHRRLGVQQQARRLAGTGSDHKRFSADTFLGASRLVDIGNCFSLSIFADDNLSRHCSCNQGQASGFLRWRNHYLTRAEVRSCDAATSALPTVMARWAAILRLGNDC